MITVIFYILLVYVSIGMFYAAYDEIHGGYKSNVSYHIVFWPWCIICSSLTKLMQFFPWVYKTYFKRPMLLRMVKKEVNRLISTGNLSDAYSFIVAEYCKQQYHWTCPLHEKEFFSRINCKDPRNDVARKTILLYFELPDLWANKKEE